MFLCTFPVESAGEPGGANYDTFSDTASMMTTQEEVGMNGMLESQNLNELRNALIDNLDEQKHKSTEKLRYTNSLSGALIG